MQKRGYATGEDRYDQAVARYGDTKKTVIPDAAAIEHYRGRVPDSLLHIWAEHGWGSWQQGRFWFCDPAFLQPLVNMLLHGDPEFSPEKAVPFAYDGFGEIHIWVANYRILRIDSTFCHADLKKLSAWNDKAKIPVRMDEAFLYEFDSLLGRGRSFGDLLAEAEEDEDMMPKLIERYGELQPGEIYGFFPIPAMGGTFSIENIQRTPLIPHLSFIYQMQRPIYREYIFPQEGEPGFGRYRDIRLLGSSE